MDDPSERIEELRAGDDADGQRLDRWLAAQDLGLSRSRLQRLIDEDNVLVDGRPLPARTRLKAGQTIRVVVPPARPVEIAPIPTSPSTSSTKTISWP